ncbi:HAD-IA family hydrolase [Streptomyces sp. 6N223]|uniref:HAD-IA family hydrolase n=1 Tax=Streptomyces sp. 6N223 TaxID=3457412 RepID=UPI003FD39A13
MFTGHIQEIGTVVATGQDRFVVRAVNSAAAGARSVCVNGVGLAVASDSDGLLRATPSADTRRRSTLGRLRSGARVNVERALSAGDPIGGHALVPARLAWHCADPGDALRRLDGLMARREIITGEVTLRQVHRRLVDAHGLALSYRRFEDAWLEPYSWPMPGMASLVEALSARHRLVLLSNVDRDYWRAVRAAHPELRHFAALLASCDLGVAKPDPEAFLRASEAAGADPSRCLFVDDTAANVEAARALGFRTHRFGGVSGLRRALRACARAVDLADVLHDDA